MAAITTVIVLIPIIVLPVILKIKWKRYWLFFLIMLPGSALINLGLKDWIFLGLSNWQPDSNLVLYLLYWPLWVQIVGITEELIKIAPTAIRSIRKDMQASEFSAVQIGWSLGCGFGVGEIWYLAFLIAFSTDPALQTIPWYQFTGFLFERILVVFLHGGMTMLACYGYSKNKWYLPVLAVLGAIGIHTFIDYLVVLSYLNIAAYIVFVGIAIVNMLLIILSFISTQTNEKKRSLYGAITPSHPEEKVEEKLMKKAEEEIISLFPTAEEEEK